MNPETAVTCTCGHFNQVIFAVCMHAYQLNINYRMVQESLLPSVLQVAKLIYTTTCQHAVEARALFAEQLSIVNHETLDICNIAKTNRWF